MKHAGKIDLAVGMSAHSKIWKNQKWDWSSIVKKLSTEHKTNETYKQFEGATKTEQLKIKDVGGYVGGYLRNGRRKPDHVLHRQLLTLDIDFAHSDFWDDFCLQYDNAAILHATHKHKKTSPRYRLVMPLSRECTPDEYVATARYIAGMLGIDLFDNTTFQCERLMFWPSSSCDVEYYAESQDGAWIDVDTILDSYTDWKDSSSWPVSGTKLDEVRTASTKQEDPDTKKGVIGAFCRTYGIIEAIDKFLSEEYKSAGNERYTYVKGSAAAGLTIYEDKFAYSHHGTDPCSNKLCNAFDLVRIHKFGHLDPSTQDGAKSKSFAAMEEFCTSDEIVKKTLASEKFSESKYDFAEDLEEDEEQDTTDWAIELEIDAKGKYLSSASNISIILANDSRLKGVFKENIFDSKKYAVKSLPWRKINNPEPIKNVDFSGIRNYLESMYGITGVMKIEDALNLEFEKQSFHPVTDYLTSLKWDGVDRIDTLLIDYFGSEDNAYNREAIRKTLVGAVARVFKPGVKFDLVLTLVGDQGTGKSTFISKLGKSWFSDTFMTVNGKEAFEQIQGAWLIEMAELSGLRKAEVESIKHFISKQEDSYRPAYGRTIETYPRQCVFFGTTNKKDFLSDPSGNRRFMPIDVNPHNIKKNIFSDELDKDLNQIWAEAVELFRRHEKLYLSKEAEAFAKIEQNNHSQTDERAGVVSQFIDKLIPEDWEKLDIYERRSFMGDPLSSKGTEERQYVCVAEVWCECLGKEKHDMTRYNTREINDILRSLEGWEQIKSTKNFPLYGKQKYYARKLY